MWQGCLTIGYLRHALQLVAQAHPWCCLRRRWRDVVRKDLKDIGVEEGEWYEEAQRSRAGWREMCS